MVHHSVASFLNSIRRMVAVVRRLLARGSPVKAVLPTTAIRFVVFLECRASELDRKIHRSLSLAALSVQKRHCLLTVTRFFGPCRQMQRFSGWQTTLALFSMPLTPGSLVVCCSTASASARLVLSSAAACRADPDESPPNRASILLRHASL